MGVRLKCRLCPGGGGFDGDLVICWDRAFHEGGIQWKDVGHPQVLIISHRHLCNSNTPDPDKTPVVVGIAPLVCGPWAHPSEFLICCPDRGI